MRQMVLEISYSKVCNLDKMDVATWRFLAHFHLNMTSQMQSSKRKNETAVSQESLVRFVENFAGS